MRALAIAAVVAVGCKGKEAPAPAAKRDAGPPIAVDWTACDAALRKASSSPLDARPQIVIDGCRVCGDWTPLLRWNTPPAEGGPTRLAIENAMAACSGYCDANGKQRFLGTLDNARGTNVRTPWRKLGEVCKEQISAVPDVRFMSAPYFALDRIARAASAHGGDTANLLSALELPLPAVSLTGVGIVLPDLDRGLTPKTGALQITLLGDAIYIGRMPRAHLGAAGVTVDLGPDGYPGKQVAIGELPTALGKLVGEDHGSAITLLAAHATPAQRLVEVVAAASKLAPVYLAANAPEAPEGWDLPATIPVALEPGPEIVLTGEMTVQNLASELARRAAAHATRAGIKAP